MTAMSKGTNPILKMDFPDPDVIYADGVYYMISTTMHFLPGGQILRSYDLLSWEHAAYVFDRLDSTDAQRLCDGKYIYGKGMWAATLRYHKGTFYVLFVCNDTKKTYLYRAEKIEGPWRKSEVEGFYHDASLLFDDDDRIYIVYGNTKIYLTELDQDLTGPKEGGLHRLLISDVEKPRLGYEGSHIYKIGGRYYLFLIHSLQDQWRRVEACFVSDSLEGEFIGGDVFDDDMGFRNSGIAQGGIVCGVDGKWHAVLFQDSGAVGRIPVVVPVDMSGKYPVFGKDGKAEPDPELPCEDPYTGYAYAPLSDSDDFRYGFEWGSKLSKDQKRRYGCFGLRSIWQFNHEPDTDLVRRDEKTGTLWITTDKLSENINHARNTLTQRMVYPKCRAMVTIDPSKLQDGDHCGLAALQGDYCWCGISKRGDDLYAVMYSHKSTEGIWELSPGEGILEEERKLDLKEGQCLTVCLEADFSMEKDEAVCAILLDGKESPIGSVHKLCFRLDHFCGARFGLFIYSTKKAGGSVGFSNFRYEK